MAKKPQRQNERDGALLSDLNAAIGELNLAKKTTSVAPAEDVLEPASALLALVRVSIPSVRVGRLSSMYTGLDGQQS
jgi:hypothetical protein